MKYINIEDHKKLLNCVATSAASLHDHQQELSNSQVSVDAEFLLHAYELLLAYAYTYEGHEAELCFHNECSC